MQMSPQEMKDRIEEDLRIATQRTSSALTILDMWLQESHKDSSIPQEMWECCGLYYAFNNEIEKLIKNIASHFKEDNLPAWADKNGEAIIDEKPNVMYVTLGVLDSIINLFMPNSVKGIQVKSKIDDGKIIINVYENVKKVRAPETERTFDKLQEMQWIGDWARKYYSTYEDQMNKYLSRMSNSTVTIKYLTIEIDKGNEDFENWIKDTARRVYKEQTGTEIDSVILKLE